jgi:hypothetical protein
VRGTASGAPATDAARVAFRAVDRPHDHAALDGVWWPHSRDLAAELPALVAALNARGFATGRVAYSRQSWNGVLKRLLVAGRVIRLGWFRTIDPNSVSMTSRDGRDRVDLLVVPSASDPRLASQAFERVLAPASRGRASATLTAAAATLADAQADAAAQTVWESEGGSEHPT